MRKTIFFLIIILCCTISVHAEHPDTVINRYLADREFFRLRDEFPQLAEGAEEPLSLFAQAYLGSYFNDLPRANQHIRTLLREHSDWLGIDDRIALAARLADNEARLQHYREAAFIYRQLVNHWPSYKSRVTQAIYQGYDKLYSALTNVSPMRIEYMTDTSVMNLKSDRMNLTTVPVSYEKIHCDFILDLGAGISMVEEQYIDEFDIEILGDSIMVRGGTGHDRFVRIGIAKEMRIGEIKIENLIFLITPDKIVEDIPGYDIRGIIGLPVMQLFEKITVTTAGQLKVTRSPDDIPYPSNMMIVNNMVYVQMIAGRDSLLMHFDSGSNVSSLSNHYFGRSNHGLTYTSASQARLASYGGFRVFPVYTIENFKCRIGTRNLLLPSIDIILEDINLTTLPVDGVIGQDIIRMNRETMIDFKNMYFDFR